MAGTAVEIDPQLIAFMLPSIPESARIARFCIRAALGFHDLGHLADDAVIVVVSDCSPYGPVMRAPSADSEPLRGLQIVASLSVHWGWHPEPHGKAIYAILATETDA